MKPQEVLAQYFETGAWRPEWDALDFEVGHVETFLANPEHALLPFANEAVFRKLSTNFGLRPSDFHRYARAAVSKIIESGTRVNQLTAYEAAIVRLVVESLLTTRAAGTALFPWADERTRRLWVDNIRLSMRPAGADGRGGFSCIKEIPPQRMLRLAVSREALIQNATAVKSAIAEAIKGAIEVIRPDEPISVEAQIRLCAIRFWLQSDEGTESEAPADRVLRAAGLDAQRVAALIEEITTERGVDGLFAREGEEIDLDALMQFREFGASADFYGFRFDPSKFDRLRRLGAELANVRDPWVKQLYRLALSRSASSAQANAELDRLGNDRARRDRVLTFLVSAQLLSEQEWAPIVNAELAGAERSLGGRLFRSLVRLRFQRDRARFDESVRALGLLEWFEDHFARYLRGEFDDTVRLQAEVLVQLALRSDAMREEPELAVVADQIRADAAGARETMERQRAAAKDREWLFDLVSKAGHLPPNRYDEGRRILLDGDRKLIRDMAELKQKGGEWWWDQQLQLGSELRLRETSVRIYGGDPQALALVADQVARRIEQQLQPQSRQAAGRQITMCRQAVIEGRVAPREQLLRAFREVNAVEFMHQLEGVEVDLPPKRRPRRVFGRRVVVAFGVLLLLPVIMLCRVLFASGEGIGQQGQSSEAQVAPAMPALKLEMQGWTELDSSGTFLYRVDAREFQRFFGRSVVGEGTSGFAIKPRSLAQEFVQRYESWLREKHPGGIKQKAGALVAWSAVKFRLPTPDDSELIRDTVGSAGDYWRSDDEVSSIGPFEEKQIHVVIEISK